MKKFRFKLEKYLIYKKLEKKICMTNLAKAMEPMNRYQMSVNKYFSSLNNSSLYLSDKMKNGNLSLKELSFYNNYFVHQKKNQEIYFSEAQKIKHKVAEERKKLQVIHNKVRVLELIRDKKYHEYLLEQNKADVHEVDELNMREYQKKMV